MKNEIIPYNPKLKELARELRKKSTLSEVLFWQKVKGKSFKYEFHRQVPLDNFIVDFYCHELMLSIEIDGNSHDEKQDYDQNRQFILENLGVKFLRFEDIDVKKKMPWILEELQIWIENYERKIADASRQDIPLPSDGRPLQRGIYTNPSQILKANKIFLWYVSMDI